MRRREFIKVVAGSAGGWALGGRGGEKPLAEGGGFMEKTKKEAPLCLAGICAGV